MCSPLLVYFSWFLQEYIFFQLFLTFCKIPTPIFQACPGWPQQKYLNPKQYSTDNKPKNISQGHNTMPMSTPCSCSMCHAQVSLQVMAQHSCPSLARDVLQGFFHLWQVAVAAVLLSSHGNEVYTSFLVRAGASLFCYFVLASEFAHEQTGSFRRVRQECPNVRHKLVTQCVGPLSAVNHDRGDPGSNQANCLGRSIFDV